MDEVGQVPGGVPGVGVPFHEEHPDELLPTILPQKRIRTLPAFGGRGIGPA
jgi:hypothetical protein